MEIDNILKNPHLFNALSLEAKLNLLKQNEEIPKYILSSLDLIDISICGMNIYNTRDTLSGRREECTTIEYFVLYKNGEDVFRITYEH